MNVSLNNLIGFVGILAIILNYFYIISKNNVAIIELGIRVVSRSILLILITYSMLAIISPFYHGDYYGLTEKIFAFISVFTFVLFEYVSIWFVVLDGDIKNLKTFLGNIANFILIIKTQIMNRDFRMFSYRMVIYVWILLFTVFAASTLSDFVKAREDKSRQKRRIPLSIILEYSVLTLGYLVVIVIDVFDQKFSRFVFNILNSP